VSSNPDDKFHNAIARMRRVEGQARGVVKMLEEDRYCVDIVQQILALESAARAARIKVLDIHAKHCLEEAFASDDKAGQSEKVSELLALLKKMTR
jgi:CsoR family transcriptional regulator, copper-sensing transcriptional repressor